MLFPNGNFSYNGFEILEMSFSQMAFFKIYELYLQMGVFKTMVMVATTFLILKPSAFIFATYNSFEIFGNCRGSKEQDLYNSLAKW